MYELIILTFLMSGPMHGYLMAKIINDMIGPYAKLSSGRLYPLLAKMQEDGLILSVENTEEQEAAKRRQRTFQITDAGRARFRQLMLDTSSNLGEYHWLFWYKLPGMPWLAPAERLHLMDHYINFCQTHIFHLSDEMADLEQRATPDDFPMRERAQASLFSMRRALAQWELDKAWALEWRAQEVARLEGLPASTSDEIVSG